VYLYFFDPLFPSSHRIRLSLGSRIILVIIWSPPPRSLHTNDTPSAHGPRDAPRSIFRRPTELSHSTYLVLDLSFDRCSLIIPSSTYRSDITRAALNLAVQHPFSKIARASSPISTLNAFAYPSGLQAHPMFPGTFLHSQ
jgi:hypothetical protein